MFFSVLSYGITHIKRKEKYVRFYYCGSLVFTNLLELLLTSIQQKLKYRLIKVRHPGTFSANLEFNCKIVCYSKVSDLMCIYCHYRHLRTQYRLNMSRFHKIYDFMILRHPGHLWLSMTKKSYIDTIISIKLSLQSYHYRNPEI